MTDPCPVCHRPLPKNTEPVVSLGHNVLIYKGIFVQLTWREAEIGYLLCEAHPSWLLVDRAIQKIYGSGGGPDTAAEVISCYMSRLNRKLKAAGIPLVARSRWYEGGGAGAYRLVPTDQKTRSTRLPSALDYVRPADRAHCPQGHPYTGDNLYITPAGHRQCRTCQRSHIRRSKGRAP